MSNEELKEILDNHKLWINGEGGCRADLGEANLSRADLSRADLREANLREANLSRADLREADLREADLREANLSRADLREADLREADLSRADLRWANLREANLSRADLREANLREANLSRADLREANLSRADLGEANLSRADLSRADLREANLSRADLGEANLSRADLSRAVGLIDPIDYLNENFDKTNEGYIAYKVFGMYKTPPATWDITQKSIIKEVVNPNRTNDCGCGINIATKEWIKEEKAEIKKAWKVLIKWEWLPSVVVPYNTDGKIRCGRAMLLEEVEI